MDHQLQRWDTEQGWHDLQGGRLRLDRNPAQQNDLRILNRGADGSDVNGGTLVHSTNGRPLSRPWCQPPLSHPQSVGKTWTREAVTRLSASLYVFPRPGCPRPSDRADPSEFRHRRRWCADGSRRRKIEGVRKKADDRSPLPRGGANPTRTLQLRSQLGVIDAHFQFASWASLA